MKLFARVISMIGVLLMTVLGLADSASAGSTSQPSASAYGYCSASGVMSWRAVAGLSFSAGQVSHSVRFTAYNYGKYLTTVTLQSNAYAGFTLPLTTKSGTRVAYDLTVKAAGMPTFRSTGLADCRPRVNLSIYAPGYCVNHQSPVSINIDGYMWPKVFHASYSVDGKLGSRVILPAGGSWGAYLYLKAGTHKIVLASEGTLTLRQTVTIKVC